MSFIVKYIAAILIIFSLLSCSSTKEVKSIEVVDKSEEIPSPEQRKENCSRKFYRWKYIFSAGELCSGNEKV